MKLDKTQKVLIVLSVVAIIIFSVASLAGLRVGSSLSEVQTDVIYTQPNQTGIDNFLNSVNIETRESPKFGIEVDTILLDSNKKEFTYSTFLNLPTATITDPEGHYLDLGSVQVALRAVSNSEQKIVVTGKFKAFLDDKQIGLDRTFTGIGFTTNKSLPLTIDGKPAFTFTFADEGLGWADKSIHYFKVYITDIDATVGEGFDTQSYKYSTRFLGYILTMTVDGTKKVVIGTDNTAISVFKSDSTIQVCGQNAGRTTRYEFGKYVYTPFPALYPPRVDIVVNGFKVVSSASVLFGSRDADFGALGCSVPQSGIPRGTDVVFRVDGKDFTVHTPLTQYAYKASCNYRNSISGIIGTTCTSNFGWERIT